MTGIYSSFLILIVSLWYEDQDDWSDYEESEEISVRLSDTDNENNGSEILARKRKRARQLISDGS